MTSLARRASRFLVAVLGSVLLTASGAAAQQIRVLLVIPTGSAKLARQVARFDDALRKANGRIVQANTLADADAVVQFTNYRRAVDDKGESEDWWYGHFKLLTPPVGGDEAAPEVPPLFQLLVIGREDWEVEPAVELLGRTLARALGLEAPAKDDGAV
jgi:hypothetical protein